MHVGMCVDMCKDTSKCICIDMCIDMSKCICIDVCIYMCIDMCAKTRAHTSVWAYVYDGRVGLEGYSCRRARSKKK